MRNLACLLAVTVTLFALGCSRHDCLVDEPAVCTDAHTLGACGGSVDAVGQTKKFGTSPCPTGNPDCVEPGDGGALCSAEPQRSTQCAGRANGPFCSGDRLVSCSAGFLVQVSTCGAGECVAQAASAAPACAFCNTGHAPPEPACTGLAVSVCSGNTILTCACGIAIDTVACDGGTACVSSTGPDQRSDAFCALATQPDARCNSPKANPTFCDGATLTTCHEGFVIDRFDCAKGCNDTRDGQATCTF